MVDTWTKVGSVAAVIAAGGAIAGIAISWWYGRRSVGDTHRAVMYDRLREARELVGTIKLTADNTRWGSLTSAGARLRSVLATVGIELPATHSLAQIEWDFDKYERLGVQARVDAARAEHEASTLKALD